METDGNQASLGEARQKGRYPVGRLPIAFTLAAACLLWLAPAPSRGSDAPVISEAQGRALFLFNFTKYVEWPAAAFAQADTPLTIGVVADTDFIDTLRQIVAGKSVAGRMIVVQALAPDADPRGCHLLFLGNEAQKHTAALLEKVAGRPILTVGESEHFLASGGMVCLAKRENRLRPRILLATAEQAGLKPSSKLLAVSEVLKRKPD